MTKQLKKLYKESEVLGMSISEISGYRGISEKQVKEMTKDEGAEIVDGKIEFPNDYQKWR